MKKILILILLLIVSISAFSQTPDAKPAATKADPKAKKAPKPSTKYIEYTTKGTKLAQDGDYKGAMKEFEKALKEKPDYMQAIFNRGLVKIKMMDYQGAVADFDAVLKLKPGFTPALLNRAAAKGYLKDYSGALSDLDQLIETKPSYARAYALRGQMKKKMKDKEGACDDYMMAMEYGDKSTQKDAELLCSSKFKGKIKVLQEGYAMEWPDTSGWKASDTTSSGPLTLMRFFKGSETLKNWTEQAAITINKGTTNVPVEEGMKSVMSEVMSTCPQAQLTMLEKNEEDEFAWIQFVIECPGKSTVYQLVQGNINQYIVSVTMKTDAIDDDTRSAWKELLTKGKVEYK